MKDENRSEVIDSSFIPHPSSFEIGPRPPMQPFLYLTTALVAGILIDIWVGPSPWLVAALVLASLAATIKFILSRKDRAATVAILIGFIATGALLSSAEKRPVDPARLNHLFDQGAITPADPVELEGRLAAPPEPAPERYYLDLEAESLRTRAEIIPAKGRARLMLPIIDSVAAEEFARLALDGGARVRVLVRLERARNYDNPGSPDFNDFLERSGYDLKGTIKSPLLIERMESDTSSSVLSWLYRLRLSVMKAIDERFNPRVAGTLKAMLMGNRYFLDKETVERLQESATYHTLAISGMHITIIAWVLLGGRSALKRRRVARILFSILALWAYAVMVGLAPPVTRATLMITVGIIGPLMFRRAASINTVALAAFAMLALKPSLVSDAGFQLSFAAVAAIVALALPLTEKLWAIGEWRPSSRAPHPPSCPHAVRVFAESLFWDERRFREDMRRAPVRYQLDKTRAARLLNLFRVQWLLRAIVLLVITSAAIQLSTLPLMVFYFNRVAPVGVLLNVMAGLLTMSLMGGAVATILTDMLNGWLAAKLEFIITALHHLLVNAVVPFANIPAATFRAAHYEGWQEIIYAVYFIPLMLLAILIDRWRPVSVKDEGGRMKDEKRLLNRFQSSSFILHPSSFQTPALLGLLCIATLLVSMIAVVRPPAGPAVGKLTVYFLDVGQGDSTLIVFPRGKTMLIDGGGRLRFDRRMDAAPGESLQGSESNLNGRDGDEDDVESKFRESSFSVGESVVSRFLWSLGLTRIDYVMATHADADHIGGLSEVMSNFRVGQAIVGRVPANDAEFNRFADTITRRGIPLSVVNAGERYELDGVSIEVHWPPGGSQTSATSGNDDSVVLRIIYGSVSVLLTGDIEQAGEDALVQSGVNLRADLLKVPHHGSRTSSSQAFIDAVRPRCAVVPVGERNAFGHPDPTVVNRYLERGVKLFETGRDGLITVETDGTTLDVRAYIKR